MYSCFISTFRIFHNRLCKNWTSVLRSTMPPHRLVQSPCRWKNILRYLTESQWDSTLGILLMFFTGIRVDELVTLKHSDFEGNTIKIRRTETRVRVNESHYEYLVKEFPKSSAGVRTIIIPDSYAWIAAKLQECTAFQEFVFVSESGTRMTTNVIRRRMEKSCKARNLHRSRRIKQEEHTEVFCWTIMWTNVW